MDMNKRDLSIRAYLIEAKYYLGEDNQKRALEYIEDAQAILERRGKGDFEDDYLKNKNI